MRGTKVFVIVLIILIIIAGVLFAMKVFGDNNTEMANANGEIISQAEEEPEVAKPKTLSGDSRPIAVMIYNHIDCLLYTSICV